jgi:prolyl 4-hydroxylase
MRRITELSAEWEQWIVLNIGRGVPADVLAAEMVKKDFDPSFAMAAVLQRLPQSKLSELPGTEPSRIAAENRIEIERHTVEVVTRISAPDIVVFQHVLSDHECDQLIALSRPKIKRSTTVDRATGAEEIIAARSSEGTFFLRGENALVAKIEKRLAALTGSPAENGEGLQILHYGVGAEYRPHFDFFEPEDPGSAAHLQKGGQRVSTTIMYLNDVDAGGATIFPEIGLEVSARKGSAVYFSYCDSQGRLDRLTLHGGAPVAGGEKWIATRWLRQGVYQ